LKNTKFKDLENTTNTNFNNENFEKLKKTILSDEMEIIYDSLLSEKQIERLRERPKTAKLLDEL
jgi:hypothetical protein